MNRPASIIFGVVLLGGAHYLSAQQVNPRVPPPPPPAPADTPAPSKSSAAPPSANTPASPPTQPIDPSIPPPPPLVDPDPDPPVAPAVPVFDPLHAQRSIDVGTFYLKKGIYDAAIERFIDATNYQPSLAMPWKLLGEAYEKKREYSKALEAYNKYLQILPHAAESVKMKKTIADLEEKTAQDSSKKAER
jgi:tetratricopeptide (TPR) repeat protein